MAFLPFVRIPLSNVILEADERHNKVCQSAWKKYLRSSFLPRKRWRRLPELCAFQAPRARAVGRSHLVQYPCSPPLPLYETDGSAGEEQFHQMKAVECSAF